jgi:hypothetical protein
VKVGDLVQVLPAKIGYYIIVEETDDSSWGYSRTWILEPVCKADLPHGGKMAEKFIEVVSESRRLG